MSNGLERTATLDQQTADAFDRQHWKHWPGIQSAAKGCGNRIDDKFLRREQIEIHRHRLALGQIMGDKQM